MPKTQLIKTVAELREALNQARAARNPRVGFVPTMGNLHDGHLTLVREARANADFVVASIFINPLQFTPGSDYDQYPRSLDADFDHLVAQGADIVFAPSVAQMYPNGHAAARVTVDELAAQLCGEFRPGHFAGVTTVVSMFFNLVQPDVAVFGEKDFQQLALIRRMVSDLHFPLEIIGVPTVRAEDGLALSSRNQYLSADERARAPQLYAGLQAAAQRLHEGDRDFAQIEDNGVKQLRAQGFTPDYFAVRTPMLESPDANTGELVVLVAATLGKARLIDNLRVTTKLR